MSKKIFFVTGTRADYGKIKSIIHSLEKHFKVYIFVTGMHLMSKYGSTHQIISKECKNSKIIKFKNQTGHQMLDQIISTTIKGISKNLKKINPDLVFIHGDRVEAFAAATAASVNNFLVAHIEGGELSGTIDEHLRHAISKLSHIHFVSNNEAKRRLIFMGEKKNSVFTVGTPDYDIMKSKEIPSIYEVKKRYGIKFKKFAILIYHSVTTDIKNLKKYSSILNQSLVKSNLQYLVIYPNNDPGSDIILNSIFKNFKNNKNFRIIRSMRFEFFLSALKNSSFIIGNSSAGIREAPFYGIPTINIGDRQLNRANLKSISNIGYNSKKILKNINFLNNKKFKKTIHFGNGNSSNKIVKILSKKHFWMTPIQKKFTSID